MSAPKFPVLGGFKTELKPKFCWMNGKLVDWMDATVHLRSPTTSGEVVYEGMRAYWSDEKEELYIWLLEEHIQRLFKSAKIRRMSMSYSEGELESALVELIAANEYKEDTYIMPQVYRTFKFPYYTMESTIECALFARPRGRKWGERQYTGVKVGVSSWRRLPDIVSPNRAKCWANYAISGLARIDATALGYDEAILLTLDGKVSEGVGETLFMVRDGKLITPPVTADILEGITREFLLKMAPEHLGYEVVERDIDLSELYIADEVFLCGTGAEIGPVVQVDNVQIANGKRGLITEKIQTAYFNIVRGKVPKYQKYLTSVYRI